jgi:hypothetical protein
MLTFVSVNSYQTTNMRLCSFFTLYKSHCEKVSKYKVGGQQLNLLLCETLFRWRHSRVMPPFLPRQPPERKRLFLFSAGLREVRNRGKERDASAKARQSAGAKGKFISAKEGKLTDS